MFQRFLTEVRKLFLQFCHRLPFSRAARRPLVPSPADLRITLSCDIDRYSMNVCTCTYVYVDTRKPRGDWNDHEFRTIWGTFGHAGPRHKFSASLKRHLPKDPLDLGIFKEFPYCRLHVPYRLGF